MKKKNLTKKEIIDRALKQIRKVNPHWIEFFNGAIEEHFKTGNSIQKIVNREFKKLRKEVKDLQPDSEKVIAKFITGYALTHYGSKT